MMRAVFLDRDGVLLDGLSRIPEDVPGALKELKEADFLLIVVTNQPDVARGTKMKEDIEITHSFLRKALPLDDIFVCYHDDGDNCSCRKPKPGMLLQAASRYSIDLSASFMIGDRQKDIEAGLAAGCKSILVDRPLSQIVTRILNGTV